jgi:UDP-glucose 4-epimerase
MSKQWIVTGANGYLGGEVCKGLARRGERAVALARPERLLDGLAEAGIACYTYDEMSSILIKGDILVHCAGKVGSTGSWSEFESVNRDLSVSLFEQAVQGGASCFVYMSSVAAVGYSNRPGSGVLDETAEPRLLEGELYGRSKWLAEEALRERAKESATRLVILRPGSIYGQRALAKRQTWLRRGEIVDPGQRVPLVHIDSLLEALYLTATNPEAHGVYFVVDDEQPTLREFNTMKIQTSLMRYQPWPLGKAGFWLLAACRVAVRRLRGRAVPNGHTRAQYCFYTRHLAYSTEKIRTETGWIPTVLMEDGLKSCMVATPEKERN